MCQLNPLIRHLWYCSFKQCPIFGLQRKPWGFNQLPCLGELQTNEREKKNALIHDVQNEENLAH